MPATPTNDLIQLGRDPIDPTALVRHVRTDCDGAIVTFDGCVRDNSHGRRTLYLDYESYESMAIAKLQEIAADIHVKFAIDRVAIAHRLGRLEIGETSVFIAVSAPHRAAAFDACRFAIDTLKRTVPIWKKEYFADGAIWADGELPPPPLNRRRFWGLGRSHAECENRILISQCRQPHAAQTPPAWRRHFVSWVCGGARFSATRFLHFSSSSSAALPHSQHTA